MTYAIIGFGAIGQALAKAFARRQIPVTVASRRDPAELAPTAAAIGPDVTAKPLDQALDADIIFVAVPFGHAAELAKTRPDWAGKTIVDVTNSYGTPPEQLDGLLSSAFNARAFTGGRLVKGFNHLGASKLAADPAVEGGHRVVFLASDDEEAVGPIETLAKELGYAPVKLGKLEEGGAPVHARGNSWGPLIFQDLFKREQ